MMIPQDIVYYKIVIAKYLIFYRLQLDRSIRAKLMANPASDLITRAKKRFYSIINRIPAWNQAAMNQIVMSLNVRPFPAGTERKKITWKYRLKDKRNRHFHVEIILFAGCI